MKWLIVPVAGLLLTQCAYHTLPIIQSESTAPITGAQFYRQSFSYNWQQRDSLAVNEILLGNIPSFLRRLVPIHVHIKDSVSGKIIKAAYYVTSDYLSIGTNTDWARIPLTPMAAQRIADSFHCFLPTRKMVDDIYRAAKVRLEPVPLYAFRDSTLPCTITT